jgi:1-acyl-sn-glycerol-3-phosphate acyltransferase
LASLWLSQAARVLADNCLRIFVVLELIRAGATALGAAWHLVAALLAAPAVFLAPLNGALGNSLPKHRVLVGAAAYGLIVVAAFGFAQGAWLVCWALVAVGAAVYGPTRYALLPAASADTGIPLNRINGWIETGAVIAIVAGMVLGGDAYEYSVNGWEAAVAAAAALNLLALLTALPARFPSDVRRPEPPGQALAGFFRDARRILADREARACLLALASLRGIVVALTGAVIAATLSQHIAPGGASVEELTGVVGELVERGVWILGGVAAGSLLASVQGHPFRALGLVPFGATGLLLGLVLAALGGVPSPGLCLWLGVMAGLINVPLAATYQAALPADARGNGMAVRNLADYLATTVLSLLLYGLAHAGLIGAAGQLWLVAALVAVGVVLAWPPLYRASFEQVMEFFFWPIYRMRGHGPGCTQMPRRGPVIVVANHACWFDPVFAGKVLPRPLVPMMTSVFYDLPVLRFIMPFIFRGIRVQAARFRREAPELAEAIAALDRGEALVIFPEGYMRRSEEKPLRFFGQGIWLILHERPQVPVVPCWIEGHWGSYFSYKGGPPTKNKKMDFWRRIDVAADVPRVLSPDILADHRATRKHLMQLCLDARRFLGLEVVSLEKADEEPAADESGASALGGKNSG